MVTRKQLEEYKSCKEELVELRSAMRQAELAAMESERECDRKRARDMAERYEAMMEVRADELAAIEAEIDALASANQRRALRLRYVHGLSRTAAAIRMEKSPESVDKYVADGIRELEKE